MNNFEITIQHKSGDSWPVVADFVEINALPVRYEDVLNFPPDWEKKLAEFSIDAQAYGSFIGEALFSGKINRAFTTARVRSPDVLQVLLSVEAPDLKHLHWERLCGPIRSADRWDFLALDQRFLFSLYLPSPTDRRFPAIGLRDLKALVLVANPPAGNKYHLDPFDAGETITSIKKALGTIPHEILTNLPDSNNPPTLETLLEHLTEGYYTILHIVAHGWYRYKDRETILYLLDEKGEVSPITASDFLDRLDQIQNTRGLPHFAFLSTCDSAKPEAEYSGALGGLAQRLVRELGMPGVLAMTEKVSMASAEALAERFYVRLRSNGRPDQALAEAATITARQEDVIVPALYSRLGGRPLFSDSEDRDLTNLEIEDGLIRLEDLLAQRAPILQVKFQKLAADLRGILGLEKRYLSRTARSERDGLLQDINNISEEVLDISFRALALGQDPPAYDPRDPFLGLLPFQPEHANFFFGREAVTEILIDKLSRENFLAVLGSSGSGKSSLVLAGLIPALRVGEPHLQLVYLTPGNDPTSRLGTSLEATDQPRILVVDQFEEVFTLCTDESKRRAFFDQLLSQTDQIRVVITMRADFWGDCAVYPALKSRMQSNQELIAPMNTNQLRSAMEQQAGLVGLRFEADLSHTILDAVKDEPGAMPLLQHLLKELWDRRHGNWLLTSEYRALGGIQQAISHTAEKLYRSLTNPERKYIRNIFIRLTKIGEEIASDQTYRDTRQRVEITELYEEGSDPSVVRNLVQRLADARLVVIRVRKASDGKEITEVEVAHEALIQYWPRLREWLEVDRKNLRLLQEIRKATQEWLLNAMDKGYLLHRGTRLEQSISLAGQSNIRLNEREQRYLEECNKLQAQEAEERLKDISEMGWGVIFPENVDPAIRDALKELLDHRREQATKVNTQNYREFNGEDGYRQGEGMWQFLTRQGISFGEADVKKVPYYLLIVGDPETIPFIFQYQLATQYAVGRIHFEKIEDYRNYAHSIVSAETTSYTLPRSLVTFAPAHEGDTATQRNVDGFVIPLTRILAREYPDWDVTMVIRDEATKKILYELAGGANTPAVLFAVGHAMGYRNGDPLQLLRQGAFVCQDWPGPRNWQGPIVEDQIFSADDINDESNPLGMIVFFIGSYTAGTPRLDDFYSSFRYRQTKRPEIAPHPFISRLPQRLLSQPKGAASAVVGHVERIWSGSLSGVKGADELSVFSRILKRVLDGFPIGAALRPLFKRYADYFTEMSSEFERVFFQEDLDRDELSDKLRVLNDARNYIILGDPAAKIIVEPVMQGLKTIPRQDSFPSGKQKLRSVPEKVTAKSTDFDLSTSGWGIIFPHDIDPAVKDALRSLLELRKQQAASKNASYYQEFFGPNGYLPGESLESFLHRIKNDVGGTDPMNLPHFLLIVGDSKSIPFYFQHELSKSYAVGRVHFDDLKAYQIYAQSVVSTESRHWNVSSDVVFFGPFHKGDRATDFSSNQFIPTLVKEMTLDGLGRKISTLKGEAATKAQLWKLLGGNEKPAFLFIACQSITEHADPSMVGSLICQDMPWDQRRAPLPDHYFSSNDLGEDANPVGLIAFLFTSYGAGTRSSLANLPLKLLGHTNGSALAVIGCIDQLTVNLGRVNPFIGVLPELDLKKFQGYQNFLTQLLAGLPVGLAAESLVNDSLTNASWVVLGDPAVKLLG